MGVTALHLPSPVNPDVSLVMVVYGDYPVALRALEHIQAHSDASYEVVVVDNASPDGAGARLRDAVSGARFVMSDTNLGYGTGANLGVLHARGRHVAILNSDIEPQPGWLSPLVEVLDEDESIAAAVPMYLETGGRVQEAGVVLGADGRGYGYGDRLDPDAPELAFRRHVDYGSAAAMIVRRRAFDAVGGFDPLYGLGYYEDADLCFAMRSRGWRTIYQPLSRVVHAGHSAFSSAQRARLLEANRVLFVSRYSTQLTGRPLLHRPPWDPHLDLIVRDWWADERLLLMGETGRLATLAEDLQRARPSGRVTLVRAPPRFARERHPAVEYATVTGHKALQRWLEGRRHHYGAVILDHAPDDLLTATLRSTQGPAIPAVVATAVENAALHSLLDLGPYPEAEAVLAAVGMRVRH